MIFVGIVALAVGALIGLIAGVGLAAVIVGEDWRKPEPGTYGDTYGWRETRSLIPEDFRSPTEEFRKALAEVLRELEAEKKSDGDAAKAAEAGRAGADGADSDVREVRVAQDLYEVRDREPGRQAQEPGRGESGTGPMEDREREPSDADLKIWEKREPE